MLATGNIQCLRRALPFYRRRSRRPVVLTVVQTHTHTHVHACSTAVCSRQNNKLVSREIGEEIGSSDERPSSAVLVAAVAVTTALRQEQRQSVSVGLPHVTTS